MYTNILRKKIHQRYNNVMNSDDKNVDTNLNLLLRFLKENGITESILEELREKEGYENEWHPKNRRGIGAGVDLNLPDNEEDYAALSLAILEKCANEKGQVEKIGMQINQNKTVLNIRVFNKIFTKKLFEYIDERILDNNFVLYLLMKYKARCEWFSQDELYELYQSDTTRGEYLLTTDLRKFLFDQGIDYPFSEPASKSGRADLVHDINGENPLTLEIKIFNPKQNYGKSYIKKGVRQAFEYSEDYNQPGGYLLIYNVSDYNLKFTTKTNLKPLKIKFEDKTIYIVIVNLFNDGKSASQKGELKSYNITEEYLKSEEK